MNGFELFLIIAGAIIIFFIAYRIGRRVGELTVHRRWERIVPSLRADAAKRSRAVIGGLFSEQLAPFLPDFPWKPTEVRFVGKPVDFLVFKGLDEKEVEEVVFVEVKSGRARLSGVERSLRRAVEDGRVSWREYRVPSRLVNHEE